VKYWHVLEAIAPDGTARLPSWDDGQVIYLHDAHVMLRYFDGGLGQRFNDGSAAWRHDKWQVVKHPTRPGPRRVATAARVEALEARPPNWTEQPDGMPVDAVTKGSAGHAAAIDRNAIAKKLHDFVMARDVHDSDCWDAAVAEVILPLFSGARPEAGKEHPRSFEGRCDVCGARSCDGHCDPVAKIAELRAEKQKLEQDRINSLRNLDKALQEKELSDWKARQAERDKAASVAEAAQKDAACQLAIRKAEAAEKRVAELEAQEPPADFVELVREALAAFLRQPGPLSSDGFAPEAARIVGVVPDQHRIRDLESKLNRAHGHTELLRQERDRAREERDAAVAKAEKVEEAHADACKRIRFLEEQIDKARKGL
jgi:hypothetical protein